MTVLHDAFRPVPRRTAVNTFLIRGGGRMALVDTGYGPDVRPTVGFMAANLAAAGLSPAYRFRGDVGGVIAIDLGDIVHVQEIQVPRPDATMAVDVDPARGVLTRRQIFDRVARERFAVAGMHLHFPGLAHLARRGDGYALAPDAWSMAMAGDSGGGLGFP